MVKYQLEERTKEHSVEVSVDPALQEEQHLELE